MIENLIVGVLVGLLTLSLMITGMTIGESAWRWSVRRAERAIRARLTR